MDTVNAAFLNDLLTRILTAAQGGTKLDISDASQVASYVCTVLSLGIGLIPVVGSSLGALGNLLGAVIFAPNSKDHIWDALHKRIEELIDSKIEEYHLKVLSQKILGFKDNMTTYTQYLKDFESAKTDDEKKDAASTLKATHISFLSVVVAGITEFQVDSYAVATLPLFSLVATMHLTLLADGIQRGKGWGYTNKNIQSMKDFFKAKTSPPSGSASGGSKAAQKALVSSSSLKNAIRRGAKAGVPTKVLESWKGAYDAIYGGDSGADYFSDDEGGGCFGGDVDYDDGSEDNDGGSSSDGDQDSGNDDGSVDYVTYAKNICAQGRKNVKLDDGSNYQGYKDAQNYEACSRYDTFMVLNVLNYAELWPYMTGDVWSAASARNVDREVFYGPYGRWAGGALWTLSDPPSVTDRSNNVTSIIVRAWDDVDGVQVKHGSSWDGFQGNQSGGAAEQLDLGSDEYVTSVSLTTGFKLGKLAFTTNKNHKLENGSAKHAETVTDVAPPGYELTSVRITGWSGASPTGCEGVILGFRPLMTDTKRS